MAATDETLQAFPALSAFLNTASMPDVKVEPYTDGKPGELLVSHVGRDDAFVITPTGPDTFTVKHLRGS